MLLSIEPCHAEGLTIDQGIGLSVSHGLGTSHGSALLPEGSARLAGLVLATSSSTPPSTMSSTPVTPLTTESSVASALGSGYKSLISNSSLTSSLAFPRLPLHSFSSLDHSLLGVAQQVRC